MPHIDISMYTGRSEELKQDIAKKVKETVTEACGWPESAVSVSIIDFEPDAFTEEVQKRTSGAKLYEASDHIQ